MDFTIHLREIEMSCKGYCRIQMTIYPRQNAPVLLFVYQISNLNNLIRRKRLVIFETAIEIYFRDAFLVETITLSISFSFLFNNLTIRTDIYLYANLN